MKTFDQAFGELRSVLQEAEFAEPTFGRLASLEVDPPLTRWSPLDRASFIEESLQEPYGRLDVALHDLYSIDEARAVDEVGLYIASHVEHDPIPRRPHTRLVRGRLRALSPGTRRAFAAAFPSLYVLDAELGDLEGFAARHPRSDIRLSFEGTNLPTQRAFAEHPGVDSVRHLRLGGRLLGRNGELLSRAPLLAKVTHLDMSRSNLDDRCASLVIGAMDASSLRALDLSHGKCMRAPTDVVNQLELQDLTYLDVSSPQSEEPSSWARFARNPHMSNLRTLGMSGPKIREDALHAIAQSPYIDKLERLDLSYCWIKTVKAASIFSSPNLRNLRDLRLSQPRGHERALSLLPTASFAPTLRSLDLSGYMLQRWLLRAIVKTPFEDLRTLNLRGTPIDDEQLAALARAPWFAGLEHLDLSKASNVSPEGILAIARAPSTRTWRRLSFDHTSVGDDALAELIASPRASTLSTLHVARSELTSNALRVLAQADHLSALEDVSFGRGSSRMVANADDLRAFESATHLEGCTLDGVHT